MVKRSSTNRDRYRRRLRAMNAACHICGRQVDYSLPHTDDMSFQADHIIPLAKGGTDTWDNIAAAHRLCNSKKRARLVAPIIRRSSSLNY